MFAILLPGWLAGMLLTLVTGPLGAFIVWRRMSYFGDTLSHSSLLGIALGLFLNVDPYYTVLVVIILIALILIGLESAHHLPIDTLLGVIAHSALSLALIITMLLGTRTELDTYLFGDILLIDYSDIYFIAIGVFLITLILFKQWKNLLSITINMELAYVDGLPVKRLKLLLTLMIALTIGLSMKFIGALIITSMLVIPAATARRFASTPLQMVIIAILIGMLSVTGGIILSGLYNTPAGPSVVITSAALFLLSLLTKPRV